jgi:hypothetical protein
MLGEDKSSEDRLIEEIEITGFDPDGEPVIQRWADGAIVILFNAMPPFFAEDGGTEAEFENFETTIGFVLGVDVLRDDREVFVIQMPREDTIAKAKAWLENYHR